MFVHLTKRMKFFVRVRLFNKRTNIPPDGSQRIRQIFGSFAAVIVFVPFCWDFAGAGGEVNES
ncbi:hypothetical protein Hanom_Chr01g00062021 [Helianthus anomalus]